MGTIIKSIAVENSDLIGGFIPLVSEAAKNCLKMGETVIEDIGMLINTGMYTENQLIEPAKASLIQNRLNGTYKSLEEEWKDASNLFSFDLHSSGGGIIQAFQVMDSFIQANDFENGLIVSGDIKPIADTAENYNYTNTAAAVLVSKSNDRQGFVKFKTETYLEFINDFKSITNWDIDKLKFNIEQSDDYLRNCVECAVKTINDFLEEEQLGWPAIDCIVTSQSPQRFSFELQEKLGQDKKVIQLYDHSDIYTSGLLFSLNQLFQNNEFIKAKNLLFVTVGAGIVVSLAYYQNC